MLGTAWSRGLKAILAAGASALALQASAAFADGGEVVSTDNGPVRGVSLEGGRQFLGIPYAAPPVGNRRWKSPAPAPRWHGVLDAREFANHCPQPATPFGLASVSEDCLYLNVFTPDKHGGHGSDHDEDTDEHGRKGCDHDRDRDEHDSKKDKSKDLPVMVWFHPGAFQFGESDDFDPSDLVDRDVIVVTLNYRLGALGFLAHPALSAESNTGSSGNYGLEDQQAALRWVQRNIEKFGGDAKNVTIFGESAGAVSVHAHMVSPQSAGLFHRAIAQSGSYSLTQPALATAQAEGTAYATAVGCSTQSAACLRAVPVATLLANQSTSPTAYLPKVDGSVLPLSVGAAFATGQFNRVPVIEGTTHDEFRLFVATLFALPGIPIIPATYPTLISTILSVPLPVAQGIATLYPLAAYPSGGEALGAVGTDAAFSCNSRVAARLLSQYVPTWVYEFSDPNAPQIFLPPVGFPYGAYHGSEVQYLFDVRATVPAPALSAQQRTLAASMQRYWTQFAKRANPNGARTPAWSAFIPVTQDSFQALVAPAPQPYTGTAFGLDHKCAVWGSP
jgi:para-nitrobenzyl esterase